MAYEGLAQLVQTPKWKEDLREASFKGITFLVDSSSVQGGRAWNSHLFPGRDGAYHEDTGLNPKQFSFSAFLVGDLYYSHRNNLVAALNSTGNGKFVHPQWGEYTAVCTGWTVSEEKTSQGMCKLELTFEEDTEILLTFSIPNPVLYVQEKKEGLLDSLNDVFLSAFDTINSTIKDLQNLQNEIENVFTVIDNARLVVSAASEFKRNLLNLVGKGIQLIYEPLVLVSGIKSLLTFYTEATGPAQFQIDRNTALEQVKEMSTIYDSLNTVPPNISEIEYSKTTNSTRQVRELTAFSAVAVAAGIVSVAEYESTKQILEVREEISTLLISIIDNPETSNIVSDSAQDLLVAVLDSIDNSLLNAGQEVEITPFVATSSLVGTYEIYGSIDKEAEILQRNDIENPAFMGSKPIVAVISG